MNSDEETMPYNIRFPRSFIVAIRNAGLDVATFIKRAAMSHQVQKEIIEEDIKQCEEKIKHLKALLKNNPVSDIFELTTEEVKALKEAGKVLEARGDKFIYGQKHAFNNTFNRDLTTKEFEYFIKEFEK